MYKISSIGRMYSRKLITADQAAELVENGMRIHYSTGCGAPYDIDLALARRAKSLKDITVLSNITITDGPFALCDASENNDRVRFASCHMSGADRKMNKQGRCWYSPMLFNELPYYWGNNGDDIDIAFMQVGPMDQWGNFNVGPQSSDIWAVTKAAKKVVVEVNNKMPRAFGENAYLNIADVDFVVEGTNHPLAQIPSKDPTPEDKKIAEFVVDKIQSGSTLQLGIGGLPQAIGTMLAESDVKDLSGHTEMLVDSYVDLYNAGKITGHKPSYPGKIAYGFAGGTQKLYDFIDDNPICYTVPVNVVNNVQNVADIPKFVSINGCIQLDLFGQIASESVGPRHISGTGGQLDFVHGAFLSPGGQSFICLHSTRKNKDGSLSSLINPTLPEGSIVTTPRAATMYVVTEYGAANLKGKSTYERAEALINIAHPDFREQLIKDAEKLGIWKNTSKCTW
ncbi:MAG: acetyl-CoA hydrolase/transferase C-terminal domain-containing protein [Eubacteriales bacterium]|nr:acetyl-CoA hydrolase/transferase C-terminal domain-containing protein [Eubacteriales bacterium]